jgi:hypothetical protein
MDEIYQRADAFLFGRLTSEVFADTWGTWDDPANNAIWTALLVESRATSNGVTIQVYRPTGRPQYSRRA